MFQRTMDATFLNRIANDPDVRPWLGGGTGEIDLGPVLDNPANLALVTEGGGWILTKQEPAIYELHTLFVKEGRGVHADEAGKAALRYVFASTDAQEIVTKVPMENRGAVMWARHCGFAERFRREDAWEGFDGSRSAISYQALEIDRWVARDDGVVADGAWFHQQFAAYDLPPHPEDPAHDRAVGAAVLMMRAGQSRKACWFYNRWARLAGYPLITLLGDAPVTVDMSVKTIKTVIQVHEGQMEVLLCRLV